MELLINMVNNTTMLFGVVAIQAILFLLFIYVVAGVFTVLVSIAKKAKSVFVRTQK